jgi:hypothetical protein
VTHIVLLHTHQVAGFVGANQDDDKRLWKTLRRWYRHHVGIGRKASSLLFEGVFQSKIPGVGRRGERGRRESADVQSTAYKSPLLPPRVAFWPPLPPREVLAFSLGGTVCYFNVIALLI